MSSEPAVIKRCARRRPEHGGANRLRRMAGDDLEFTAIFEQFRQSLMDELAGIVAEQFALLFFQLAARAALLTAKQCQQALGDLAPARIVDVEVARNDAIASVADGNHFTCKHDAAAAARW